MGGVRQAGVGGVVPGRAVGRGVVGAVVDEPHDAVGRGSAGQPPGRADDADEGRAFDGQVFLRFGPHRVLRRQQQAGERLAGPVGRGGARVVLPQQFEAAVPAQGQRAVRTERAAVEEVAQDPAARAAGEPRAERCGVEEGADEEGGGGAEPVDEGTPLEQGRPVPADQVHRVVEERVQPVAVPRQELRVGLGAGDAAVPQREEVHRPAVVVVEVPVLAGAPGTVGVPAAARVPALGALHGAVDVRRRVRRADGAEECGDHGPEPQPVVGRHLRAGHAAEPVHGALPDPVRQPVPQPVPGLVQADGDGRRLDPRLRQQRGQRPAARRLRIGAGRQPFGVRGEHVLGELLAGVRRTVGRQEEGAGVPLQAVAVASRTTGRARQVDQGVAGPRVPPDRGQQPVRRPFPVGAGQAGDRRDVPGGRGRAPAVTAGRPAPVRCAVRGAGTGKRGR